MFSFYYFGRSIPFYFTGKTNVEITVSLPLSLPFVRFIFVKRKKHLTPRTRVSLMNIKTDRIQKR